MKIIKKKENRINPKIDCEQNSSSTLELSYSLSVHVVKSCTVTTSKTLFITRFLYVSFFSGLSIKGHKKLRYLKCNCLHLKKCTAILSALSLKKMRDRDQLIDVCLISMKDINIYLFIYLLYIDVNN